MKYFDDMNVLERVKESKVLGDAKILDCGWATKNPSEVRARVVLKDNDDLYAPTPTSMAVRCFVVLCLLVSAGSQHFRCESSVHARSCIGTQFAKPPVEQRAAGWLWMAVADQESNARNENSVEKILVAWSQT